MNTFYNRLLNTFYDRSPVTVSEYIFKVTLPNPVVWAFVCKASGGNVSVVLNKQVQYRVVCAVVHQVFGCHKLVVMLKLQKFGRFRGLVTCASRLNWCHQSDSFFFLVSCCPHPSYFKVTVQCEGAFFVEVFVNIYFDQQFDQLISKLCKSLINDPDDLNPMCCTKHTSKTGWSPSPACCRRMLLRTGLGHPRFRSLLWCHVFVLLSANTLCYIFAEIFAHYHVYFSLFGFILSITLDFLLHIFWSLWFICLVFFLFKYCYYLCIFAHFFALTFLYPNNKSKINIIQFLPTIFFVTKYFGSH